MVSQFPLSGMRFACLCKRLARWTLALLLLVIAGSIQQGPLAPGAAQAQRLCADSAITNTRYIIVNVISTGCLISDTAPTNEVFYLRITPGDSVVSPADPSVFEFEVRDVDGSSADTSLAFTYVPPPGYMGSQGADGTARYLGDTIGTTTLTIQVNAKGDFYTFTISDLAWTDGSNTATLTEITVSGGVFAPAPPPASPPSSPSDPDSASSPHTRAVSQQSSSTSILSGQSANLFSSGVSSAVAQRFRGGSGGAFGLGETGQFGSAYVSTLGLSQWMRDRHAERMRDDEIVSIYDPLQPGQRMPHIHEDPGTAQEAIDAAFGSPEPLAPGGQNDADDPALGFAAYDPAAPIEPVEEAPPSLNVWARGTFTHFDGDTFDGDAFAGVVGIDYLIADNILIGAMGGYESGDFTFPIDSGAFQGDGITVGGYTAIELAAGLVAEAYVTRTQLEYENHTATGIGTTQAKRTLAAFNLSGSYALSERLMFEPNVRVTYAHERQDAYTMSDGTSVGEEVIDSGTLSAGSRVSYVLPFDAYGRFRVFASGHGEFMYSSDDPSSTTLPDFSDITSARIGLGFDALFLNGWFLAVDGNVGGVGSDSFLSYTGTGRLRIPLN